jgi:phosphoribosylanthranilate isomerase
VFAESMRRITPEAAAEITRRVPGNIEKIGVFIAETPERIKSISDQVGLTAVQLHQPIEILDRGDLAVIPVMHMTDIEQLERNGGSYAFEKTIQRVLLDSGNSEKGGGTGKCFDWERAHRFLQNSKLDTRFQVIVAGGLTPANITDAIRTFRPYGVDVVSGVEREKGKKDPAKVRAFIAAVRAVDAQG